MFDENQKKPSPWYKVMAVCGAGMGIGFGTCALSFTGLANGEGWGPIAMMGAAVFCLCGVGLVVAVIALIFDGGTSE